MIRLKHEQKKYEIGVGNKIGVGNSGQRGWLLACLADTQSKKYKVTAECIIFHAIQMSGSNKVVALVFPVHFCYQPCSHSVKGTPSHSYRGLSPLRGC